MTGMIGLRYESWRDAYVVEQTMECPLCHEVLGNRQDIAGPLLRSQANDGRAAQPGIRFTEHLLREPHTDQQWREAYFRFKPLDAVPEVQATAAGIKDATIVGARLRPSPYVSGALVGSFPSAALAEGTA